MSTLDQEHSNRVSVAEVQRIAELSRLSPSKNEQLKLAGEMNRILGHIEQLNELDTSSIEPLHHVLDLHNVLREDLPGESLPVEVAISNAPVRKGDYFLVPKVIAGADE